MDREKQWIHLVSTKVFDMVLPNMLWRRQKKPVPTPSHDPVSTYTLGLRLIRESIKSWALQKWHFYSGFSLTTQIMNIQIFKQHEARRDYKLFETQKQNSNLYWQTAQKLQNSQGKIQYSNTNTHSREREIGKYILTQGKKRCDCFDGAMTNGIVVTWFCNKTKQVSCCAVLTEVL